MANQSFINQVVPGAKEGYKEYGVYASVTIAQAILESGWGASYSARVDNNLFGIKYAGNHSPNVDYSKGSAPSDGTGGYYARYGSWTGSIIDHGYFLRNNSRYSAAFSAGSPEEQIKAIAAAGYATDPSYASSVIGVINDNSLKQYDTGSYTGSSSSTETMTIPSTNYQVVANSQKEREILYGRRYRITISDDSGNGVDVSNLRCTFSIVKTIQAQPNSSTVTIYNLNAQTENAIEISATRITVEAGYEGQQYGLIFDGDILQTIRDKEDGATYRLTIVALDSDRAVNYELANFSILRGQTARSIVDHIVNKAQYPVSLGSISQVLDNSPRLTRGKVFFGKASDYFNQIAESNGCKYYTEDGKVNLVKLTELSSNEIYDLSPKSGLLGTPEQSEYGITGQCLLNPNIKVNSLIHVDNSLVRARQIDLLGSSNSVPNLDNTGSSSSVRQQIITEAKKLCDDPNVGYSQQYRGQTINGKTYYDCSLFVKHCYNNAGIDLDDITNPQWANVQSGTGGKVVSQSEAKAGDIVFWFSGGSCYHVAIYDGSGGIYAARTSNAAFSEQVRHQSLYGSPKFGRPKGLVESDSGMAPSANGTTDGGTGTQSPVYRSLDKDGIYRVIKVTYEGDTRGDDWYTNFETITQAGGQIPIITN